MALSHGLWTFGLYSTSQDPGELYLLCQSCLCEMLEETNCSVTPMGPERIQAFSVACLHGRYVGEDEETLPGGADVAGT